MEYTGNDQENGWTNEIEERKQRRRKEELQKTVERIEKTHRQD
jgi:hypothetical protein